jgi:hypothetical protein
MKCNQIKAEIFKDKPAHSADSFFPAFFFLSLPSLLVLKTEVGAI